MVCEACLEDVVECACCGQGGDCGCGMTICPGCAEELCAAGELVAAGGANPGAGRW